MEEERGYIHFSHNVANFIYHFFTTTKYRRLVITKPVEESIWQICAGIELQYDRDKIPRCGAGSNHVHWLVQSTLASWQRKRDPQSNRDVSDWSEFFSDMDAFECALDRLCDNATICISFSGESYRGRSRPAVSLDFTNQIITMGN